MTDLDIANRALVLIGAETIGSLSDKNKAARTMSGALTDTKRAVLSEFPWTFNNRIEPLEKTSGSVPGYSNVFKRPSDALNIHRVYGSDKNSGIADYRQVNNLIAANISSGSVEYSAYIDDVNIWPANLQECLAIRLASYAAITMTGNPQLSTALQQQYMMLANLAAQGSANEENTPPMRRAEYVNSR